MDEVTRLSSRSYCLLYSISCSSTPLISLSLSCPVSLRLGCYRLVDYEGLAPFVRSYLRKKKSLSGRGGREGGEKSVAPTCLWRWDSMLVVTVSRLRWDARGWEGRRVKNLSRCQSERFDESGTDGWVSPPGGAGLKMSSAGRCPHPELSNLAWCQCTYYHITPFPIKTWHAH